uniref:Uncharacterized protein n=1 Tax=Elizabethkingia anophelis TaxID=1117645 RepID=A0A455ZCP7_9FLAO|nr:TPA_exp: hypothetical protein [Elizabethkingia anophelis]
MSGMKINNIGNGTETKQHLHTIPNKSKKIHQISIIKNQRK